MARALTMQRTVVTPADRGRFLERARMLRTHYHRANCQYWVFEDAEVGGAFLEFAEAADQSMLAAAQAAAPDAVGVDPTRLYCEVEI
jgi:hypothetical protein